MVTTLPSSTTSCNVALPLKCNGGLRNKPIFTMASCLKNKIHIQASLNMNGTSTNRIPSPIESQEIIKKLLVPRQFGHAEPSDGRLLHDGRLLQQNFTVRSFEIGHDFKISIGTLMNYLQETALNHVKSVGVLADGFGSTFGMTIHDLIWVICWSHIEVDYYPSWDDVIQVDAWMYRSGKNAIRRDWHIRDSKTGRTSIRATSLCTMMNKKTRKFAKVTEEAIGDFLPYFSQCNPIIEKDSRNLVQLDTDNSDYIRTGLMPAWTDLDVNQHVSHIKLVNYVLEGVPPSVLETHELCAMTLEYRKECNKDSTLQSLSKISSDPSNFIDNQGIIALDHLLRLESGPQVVKGRTKWRPKYVN